MDPLKINKGMSLAEFKMIFFWEYLHRLLGRLIGIVFIIPFTIFCLKKWFDRGNISCPFCRQDIEHFFKNNEKN